MADEGISSITTQNMEGNAPILAANRTLGFVPDFVYVDVVRDLGPVVRRGPLRCRVGGGSSLLYCVIRVSGPGVYGECADR